MTSRTSPAAQPNPPTPRDVPVLRARRPGDVVDLIPYLLGFAPRRSIVVLGFRGGRRQRVRLTLRTDLPPAHHADALAAGLLPPLRQARADSVVIALYPDPPVARDGDARLPGHLIVSALTAALGAEGIGVLDALCVTDERFWSFLCTNPRCCPPEGTPRDGVSAVQAEATVAGLVVRDDREQLRAEIAPVGSLLGAQMEQLLEAEAERWSQAVTAVARSVRRQDVPMIKGAALAQERVETVRLASALLTAWRESGAHPSRAQAARLIVGVHDKQARDEVLAGIPDDAVPAARELWAWLTRHAVPSYEPPAATMCALLAWEMGDGAVARMALERALAADPEYQLAVLSEMALGQGFGPEHARQVRSAGRRVDGAPG